MTDSDARTCALAAYRSGDSAAPALIARALAAHPTDGALLIADAVLATQARLPDPLARLDAMLTAAPDWVDGHVARAELAWAMGERDHWLGRIEQALAELPRHGALWMRLMTLLAGAGQPGKAADIANRLRQQGGDVAPLRLIEARHAGTAGQLGRAGALLATLPDDMAEAWIDHGRHALRLGDPAAAEPWLSQARANQPDDPAVWALTELIWRALEDTRHPWLINPDTMIQRLPVLGDAAALDRLAAVLRGLHRDSLPPVGQSVRAGTQTRGALTDRAEPELRDLFDRLRAAIADYRAALPPIDPTHPLLRHRDTALAIRASWSIRLTDGGHHVSHLHDHGVLSSACHIVVPDGLDSGARQGWLELGRPPAGMALALEPLAVFAPKPGTLILFPSFLYHGTRPFPAGERLTVAMDVAPAD